MCSSWRQYFENRHEGLGTTYERFVLHEYFKKILEKYSVQSVLEAPSFGMTGVSGINSMWWAFNDSRITVVDHSLERIDLIKDVWRELSLNADVIYNSNDYRSLAIDNHSFDMGWNFAALWFVSNLYIFLEELTRVCKKVIFICVPNKLNVFHLFRVAFQKNSDSLVAEKMNLWNIKAIMQKLNWKVEEHGFFDVPPWPDIAMNKEELLEKMGLKKLGNRLEKREGSSICILDFFSGKNPNMEKEMLKYSWLENSPWFIKRFWAHHQYFIFTPH